jgi:hypothetical protein
MTDNLFSKGCLVKFSTSTWTARAKIPSKTLLNGSHANVDPRSVNATKKLVDGKTLKDVEAIRSEARAWLYAQSLPFPLEGAVFVPVAEVERIHAKLEEYKTSFDAAAEAFCTEYPQLRESARALLGDLYSSSDYPSSVRNKFGLSWQFITLAPPSETQLLSPALVAKAQADFQDLMAQAGKEAVEALRSRFAACVDHMVDRLSGEEDGKPKIFRDSLVGNLHEFLDSFEALNVCNDKDLAALVAKARGAVKGVSAEDLRKQENVREHVASAMAGITEKLDKMMVERPTRKVRLAPAVAKPAA